jgi:hypothetical protein
MIETTTTTKTGAAVPASSPVAAAKEEPSCSKQAAKKKSVTFVEEKNTILEFDSIDREDTELVTSLWHQPWEMHGSKEIMKSRARQWRKTGLGILLDDVFDDPEHGPLLTQKRLNAFVQLPDELYMRGVERYLSRKHDQERTARKRSIVRDVVVQAESLKGVKNMPLKERQTVLALFAKQYSRDAELYARRIAKADEVCLLKGEDPSQAEMLVEYLVHLEREAKSKKQIQSNTRRSSFSSAKNHGKVTAGHQAGGLQMQAPAATQHAHHELGTSSRRHLQARQA